jgi:hypothetical protein
MVQTSLNNVSIRLKSGGHSFSTSELSAEMRSASQPVEVAVLTTKSTLVPAEFFDAHHAADCLAEVGLAPTMGECAVYSNAKSNVVAVMALNKHCYEQLTEAIPSGVTFTSPLLDDELPEKGSILHLEADVLYVRVADGGLLLAEAFECKNDADVLYYLAKVDEVYNIYNMYARAKGDVKRLHKLLKPLFKDLVCE